MFAEVNTENLRRPRPLAPSHENEQAELKDLLAVLVLRAERIDFGKGFAGHFQLEVALRRKQDAIN